MFRRREANYYTSNVTALKLGSYGPVLSLEPWAVLFFLFGQAGTPRSDTLQAWAVQGPWSLLSALAGHWDKEQPPASRGVLQDCESEKVQKETGMMFSANHRQVGKRSETSSGDLNTESWLTGRSLTWTPEAGGGPGAILQRRSSQVTIYLVSHTCR